MGKTWLLQAVERKKVDGGPDFDIVINRNPFFLYPGGNHPIKGWGDRINALYSPTATQSIGGLGTAAGYAFDFAVQLSDTMDSHRLVLWAEQLHPGTSKGEELAHGFGRRYFERRTPLADTAMLLEVVAEVGLDMEAARAHLDSGRGYDAVRDGVASARAGTQSIPVFVFTSGGWSRTVHGSSSVDTFVGVLDEIERYWQTEAAAGTTAPLRSEL